MHHIYIYFVGILPFHHLQGSSKSLSTQEKRVHYMPREQNRLAGNADQGADARAGRL